MANVTVIGAQWGDEGKGKIVDWLSERADVVARFQGGHNAGHTLVVGDKVYKLSLLPSGIVRGTLSVIGNGVVLDPWHFRDEVAKLKGQGVEITPDNLQIAETCPLILPFHRDLDGLREDASGAGKIGTTRRGIGPAYEDKVGRRAIRVCDLAHLDDLGPQIDRLTAHHDALRAGFNEAPIDRAALLQLLAAERGDRDRHVDQPLFAAAGGNGDEVEIGIGGCLLRIRHRVLGGRILRHGRRRNEGCKTRPSQQAGTQGMTLGATHPQIPSPFRFLFRRHIET